jgi:hypothetical protein
LYPVLVLQYLSELTTPIERERERSLSSWTVKHGTYTHTHTYTYTSLSLSPLHHKQLTHSTMSIIIIQQLHGQQHKPVIYRMGVLFFLAYTFGAAEVFVTGHAGWGVVVAVSPRKAQLFTVGTHNSVVVVGRSRAAAAPPHDSAVSGWGLVSLRGGSTTGKSKSFYIQDT